MTRAEREALIGKLQAENAQSLLDLAARERRTAEGRDPPEWTLPERRAPENDQRIVRTVFDATERQERALALAGGLVQKDFSAQPQPTYMDDATQRLWDDWAAAIARAEAIKEGTIVNNQIIDDLEKSNAALQERFDRRKQYFEKQNADLSARIDELETRVSEIEDRLDALEGNGKGYQG